MRGIFVLAASALTAGCALAVRSEGSRHPAVRVVTDSAAYTLVGPGMLATVQVSVINATPDTVMLAPCGVLNATEVQRLEGSAWRGIDRGICATVLSPPTLVPPGETERFPVHLSPGLGGTPSDWVGTLRIVLGISALRVDGRGERRAVELPLAERASPPFTTNR